MTQGTWVLERCDSERFPYRLQVIRGGEPWLVPRTQDRWPTAGRHIFCLREEEPPEPDEILEEVERVDIIAFNERGKRVSVMLVLSIAAIATGAHRLTIAFDPAIIVNMIWASYHIFLLSMVFYFNRSFESYKPRQLFTAVRVSTA